jgi:hypothetical protein
LSVEPTLEQYARFLADLVDEDGCLLLSSRRTGKSPTSWRELHDVVDANEYVIEADQHFGTGHAWDDEYFEFRNAAITLAERLIWPDVESQVG